MSDRITKEQLLEQLGFHWEKNLWPRVQGLTDDEYFWEPVPGCWTVHPEQGTIDWAFPPPDPAPVTTIAWRLAHISVTVFGIRASAHFGDGSLTLETATWPGDARTALQTLHDQYHAWQEGVRNLDDLDKPVGAAEGPWAAHPYSDLVLHINREAIHHGAEVALLRDLYRAAGGAAVPVGRGPGDTKV